MANFQEFVKQSYATMQEIVETNRKEAIAKRVEEVKEACKGFIRSLVQEVEDGHLVETPEISFFFPTDDEPDEAVAALTDEGFYYQQGSRGLGYYFWYNGD